MKREKRTKKKKSRAVSFDVKFDHPRPRSLQDLVSGDYLQRGDCFSQTGFDHPRPRSLDDLVSREYLQRG